MSFEKQLSIGKTGESQIAKWLLSCRYHVLPVYEKEIGEYKGPVLFTANGDQLICPDIFAFSPKRFVWIEAKHKSAFTWHRKTQRWTTGIDINHYQQYLRVANELVGWPVWLLFLHRDGIAKDTPEGMTSPTGLFGREINELSRCENHRSDKHGRHGMVYWSVNSLKKMAELNEVVSGKSLRF